MTKEKAIEIINLHLQYKYLHTYLDLRAAIKLGKEALIRHDKMQTILSPSLYALLPGETED